MTTISTLPFDSSLFGYPVGKYEVDEIWNEESFLEKAQDFDLVYIFSHKPLITNSTGIRHVDTKITFEKELTASTSEDPDVIPYSGPLSDQLLYLALESGIYSRFKTDPKFLNGEFEKLYGLWIQKAIEQHEVLVAKGYSGFVTCKVGEGSAQIGLIAVEKNQRGKGWAKRLLQAAENFAFQNGSKTMTVPTQEANIPACKLYKSQGYTLKSQVHIYHSWIK